MNDSYVSVNGINIVNCDEKNKFKIEFCFGDEKTTIVFDYDDLVYFGSDKKALRKMLPYIIILNHMLEEYDIENVESEEN